LKIIKESSISTSIIFAGLFIIATLMISSSYYFINNQYLILDREIKEMKDDYVVAQRKMIRKEVDSIIDFIRFKRVTLPEYTQEQYKEDLKAWIRDIRFGAKKDNYLFVYEIKDFGGGDKFAKMLVNANRPDLEGEYISSEF